MLETRLPPVVASCRKNIELLNVFQDDCAPEDPWHLEMIPPHEVPEPYRALLVHERDMTSTLARFHGDEVTLHVLAQKVVDGEVLRHVVLRGKRTGRSLEYGASRIRLTALAEPARAEVLKGAEPFGGILNALGMSYRCCPGGFLRVRADERIAGALQFSEGNWPDWLYGRCNCLSRDEIGTLAEVVEILPLTH